MRIYLIICEFQSIKDIEWKSSSFMTYFRWKLVIELLYILRVFMTILHYSRFCNICSSYLTTLWNIFIDPCWKHCAFIYYISLWIVSKQNQWQRKFILRETQTFFRTFFKCLRSGEADCFKPRCSRVWKF